MPYRRFAIFYLPPPGLLTSFATQWLGWDVLAGQSVTQLDLDGLEEATQAPRKYGFHGTLKPPFQLAEGSDLAQLTEALSDLAGSCDPAECEGLELTRLGRFFALTPVGDTQALKHLAARCVQELDRFRAPLKEDELLRRRKKGLSPRQDALLQTWGYPYVMEEFRFHLTLTGRLPKADLPHWQERLSSHLPPLPSPFRVEEIALVGERENGFFQLIQKVKLGSQCGAQHPGA